jgi:hypothetical protein
MNVARGEKKEKKEEGWSARAKLKQQRRTRDTPQTNRISTCKRHTQSRLLQLARDTSRLGLNRMRAGPAVLQRRFNPATWLLTHYDYNWSINRFSPPSNPTKNDTTTTTTTTHQTSNRHLG